MAGSSSGSWRAHVNQDFGYGGRRATLGANYVAPLQLVIGAKLDIGDPPRDQRARAIRIVHDAGSASLTQSQVSERLHSLTAAVPFRRR